MSFMDRDFLLTTKTARRLYHHYAADMPIFDYHCHLIPRQIAEDTNFSDIAQVWLGGDHYKWRAMRSNGVNEHLITGDAEPREKFQAWAQTLPYLLGNPLYHWTHLELQRFFGITEVLDGDSAEEIWQECNRILTQEGLSARRMITQSKVYTIGTTDDPADSLEWHRQIRQIPTREFSTRVIPSFRPDPYLAIDSAGFPQRVADLARRADRPIHTLDDLVEVLSDRIDFFDSLGCRASDHALETVGFTPPRQEAAREVFLRAMEARDSGTAESPNLPPEDRKLYQSYLLVELARRYSQKGWAMQLHIAARRNNNSRFMDRLGPDTGFDSVQDLSLADGLAGLLNHLESQNCLPKTVLYSLNPKDYYTIGTLMGCYQGGGIPGKIQFGSAWWFNDHRDGMEEQMRILGNLGLLPRFIGMLTDSRSFLSYTRHEYFRRILCNLLGGWAEAGEIPRDEGLLGKTVQNISFTNALEYFG